LHLSIRNKLGLLAGIPMVGALLLALQIILGARDQARKAEALGSIESLAELSAQMTSVVHALQLERASESLLLGLHKREQKDAADGQVDPAVAAQAQEVEASTVKRISETDQELARLNAFLTARDVSRLPTRLAGPLAQAQARLKTLAALRANVTAGKSSVNELFEFYRGATLALVRAVAGLTDLSDDGELLRSITSLGSLLELEERMSQEHALLAHVFALGEFPPGSYRDLVALISEQDIYVDVFRTSASVEHQARYGAAVDTDAEKQLHDMRKKALETTEDDLTVSSKEWFRLYLDKLNALSRVERMLNDEVREAALDKFRQTQRALTLSVALALAVVLFSLVFAWILARGITRSVEILRDASKRIASGDLDVRVTIDVQDELGQLGGAFNDMTTELGNARAALSNQVRMARELEIAAQIQRALLPPTPRHPDFEFAGRMLPADEVGGDFYDVLSDPKSDALWITVGDVSGHGVGAGLVMLMAQAAFASHFLNNSGEDAGRVLREVNALLCENISNRLRDNKYVTAQLLTYAGQGRFVCVGAHEWPLVYRAKSGRCEVIEAPGPWLGIVPDLPEVPVTIVQVEPGDVLCLYSDGVTEAQNTDGELFDVERLGAVIAKAMAEGKVLDDVTRAVFDEVETFSGRHDDDWTLLLAKRA